MAELGLIKVTRDGTAAYALPPRLIEAETSGELRVWTRSVELECLDGQVQPADRLDDPRPACIGLDPSPFARVDAQLRRDLVEGAAGVEIDVDHGELVRADGVEIEAARSTRDPVPPRRRAGR